MSALAGFPKPRIKREGCRWTVEKYTLTDPYQGSYLASITGRATCPAYLRWNAARAWCRKKTNVIDSCER